MSTKRNEPEYIDGWEGLASEMAKQCKSTYSQCVGCKNELTVNTCKIFGKKPHKYASVLANVQCPKRKEK